MTLSIKKASLFFLSLLIHWNIYSQSNHLTHHTMIGGLLGKSQYGDLRVGYSINHFFGVDLTSNHQIGFTTGIDNYMGLNIVPIAFSWRGYAFSQKKYSPFIGIDLGHGATWLEKEVNTEIEREWYEGGFLGNASIGVRKKTKKNKVNYSWSIGLKRQKLNYNHGYISPIGFTDHMRAPLPPGFNYLTTQYYKLNSLNVMWGIIF
jgi:hypothetical protein